MRTKYNAKITDNKQTRKSLYRRKKNAQSYRETDRWQVSKNSRQTIMLARLHGGNF